MRVNTAAIEDALQQLVGTAQYDLGDPVIGFPVTDPDLDARVERVLRERILTGLEIWTPDQVDRLRSGLSYALTFDRPFLDR